jgi:hypothetical protein
LIFSSIVHLCLAFGPEPNKKAPSLCEIRDEAL